ncbi:hypothetical protein AVEN_263963-1 [Araneus ventricosus]|uniref:Uncharacterized protein n=1 Tax=Araneus ventricosus TaxID=182803 RepID=A0A4Y2HNE7_ARAVE|nr:hypothetical protein AVEN_263963-1 [Araneus ventricosus]
MMLLILHHSAVCYRGSDYYEMPIKMVRTVIKRSRFLGITSTFDTMIRFPGVAATILKLAAAFIMKDLSLKAKPPGPSRSACPLQKVIRRGRLFCKVSVFSLGNTFLNWGMS